MSQTLTLKSILEGFRNRWSNAPDVRKPNNNTRYEIIDAILAAFSVFFMQSGSFLAHQRLIQSNQGRNNATSLFKIEVIPSDQQIRNLLDPIPVKYFQADFWRIWDELNEHKQILKFRSDLGSYLVALDGVTHFSSEKISCPECLKREDKQGTEHFYHSAITPSAGQAGQRPGDCASRQSSLCRKMGGRSKIVSARRSNAGWQNNIHILVKGRSPIWEMTYMPTSLCAN